MEMLKRFFVVDVDLTLGGGRGPETQLRRGGERGIGIPIFIRSTGGDCWYKEGEDLRSPQPTKNKLLGRGGPGGKRELNGGKGFGRFT